MAGNAKFFNAFEETSRRNRSQKVFERFIASGRRLDLNQYAHWHHEQWRQDAITLVSETCWTLMWVLFALFLVLCVAFPTAFALFGDIDSGGSAVASPVLIGSLTERAACHMVVISALLYGVLIVLTAGVFHTVECRRQAGKTSFWRLWSGFFKRPVNLTLLALACAFLTSLSCAFVEDFSSRHMPGMAFWISYVLSTFFGFYVCLLGVMAVPLILFHRKNVFTALKMAVSATGKNGFIWTLFFVAFPFWLLKSFSGFSFNPFTSIQRGLKALVVGHIAFYLGYRDMFVGEAAVFDPEQHVKVGDFIEESPNPLHGG